MDHLKSDDRGSRLGEISSEPPLLKLNIRINEVEKENRY